MKGKGMKSRETKVKDTEIRKRLREKFESKIFFHYSSSIFATL